MKMIQHLEITTVFYLQREDKPLFFVLYENLLLFWGFGQFGEKTNKQSTVNVSFGILKITIFFFLNALTRHLIRYTLLGPGWTSLCLQNCLHSSCYSTKTH